MKKYLLTILISALTTLSLWYFLPPNIWDNFRLFGAISFPASLDTLTNPAGTDSVATVSHSGQHSNANDAIEALEAKIGINASTPVTDSFFVGTSAGGSQWSTYATGTSAYFTNYLATGSTTLQNFTFVNATGTSATTTNFFSTTASSTNLNFTTGNGNGLTLGSLTLNGLGTLRNLLLTGSSTLKDFTFDNATGTAATTTSFFSTTASSTRLYSTQANLGAITISSCSGSGCGNNPIVYRDHAQATAAMTSAGTWYEGRAEYGVGQFTAAGTDSFRISTLFGTNTTSGDERVQIEIGNGTASTTIYDVTQSSGYVDPLCEFNLYLRGATNSWVAIGECMGGSTVTSMGIINNGTPSTVELSAGFNIVASSTSSVQNSRTFTSEYFRVEKLQ